MINRAASPVLARALFGVIVLATTKLGEISSDATWPNAAHHAAQTINRAPDACTPAVAMASPSRSQIDVFFDESVRFKGFAFITGDAMPPTLYVDGWTVLREVSDVRQLKAGDHCVVGVNLMHTLFTWSDRLCSIFTSWGLVPFFHHFVLIDSVDRLSSDGRPLRRDGRPCRVAEFSDTPVGAWRRVSADGYSPRALLRNALNVLRAPAKLHLPPLSDYCRPSHGSGRGIFLVSEDLSVEQRKKTVDAALSLVEDFNKEKRGRASNNNHASSSSGGGGGGGGGPSSPVPVYRVLSANCEHLAWKLDSSSKRWMSPQVSHNLWVLFRFTLQFIALFFLHALHVTPHECERKHTAFATAFHLLSTIPVGAQLQIILIRCCVNLTQRRDAGHISRADYDYLMVKEVSRACLVMGVSVGCLSLIPRLVWDTGRIKAAMVLSLYAHSLAHLTYNAVQLGLCRLLLWLGVGVPVPRFDDVRTVSGEGDDEGDEFNTGGAADSPPVWRPRSKGEIFSGRSFENLEVSTDDTQQQRRRRQRSPAKRRL